MSTQSNHSTVSWFEYIYQYLDQMFCDGHVFCYGKDIELIVSLIRCQRWCIFYSVVGGVTMQTIKKHL